MALWGNNDNVGSAGTVSLNYDTGVVTGTDTLFGQTGSAQEGDVISFGLRTKPGVYFGDAVIISIASTESLTIGSTAGLSGVAIAGTDFTISQAPKYTVLDSSFSEVNTAAPAAHVVARPLTNLETAAGILTVHLNSTEGIIAGDTIDFPTYSTAVISSVGSTSVVLTAAVGAGDTVATGSATTVSRTTGGYQRNVYGVGSTSVGHAEGGVYATGAGWVGVTTYRDTSGNLRVKKEILVAMSGIATGNAPVYPDIASAN